MHGSSVSLMAAHRATAERRQAVGGRRVLVVEDNPDIAESLRLLLEFFGYEVWVAATGPEGVRLALARRPDVVLCDIGLPGLDGFGVAAALRRDPATAAARLVAITGYGSDEVRRRCREVGFDRYFTKPVDPDVLVDLVATAPALSA
jgi:two-component system CheB/CheR fusion protein